MNKESDGRKRWRREGLRREGLETSSSYSFIVG